jgi:hypothetical protein
MLNTDNAINKKDNTTIHSLNSPSNTRGVIAGGGSYFHTRKPINQKDIKQLSLTAKE